MWLKNYLIITGIGAFIALTMPVVVVIASFLFIPGLILISMPTAFMYGGAFALLRILLGKCLSGVPLNLLSSVTTLGLFYTIPQPTLISARNWLASLKEPDVLTDAPITLKGDILVTRSLGDSCDGLCAALFKTPGVTSVRIVVLNGAPFTYRIVQDSAPGKRANAIGYGLLEKAEYNASDHLAGRRALESEWNLMLSEGKALVVSDDRPEPDFTIAIEDRPAVQGGRRRYGQIDWSLESSTPNLKALIISNAKKKVLLRQSILSIFVPSAPLLVGMSGGIENFRFGWHGKRLGDGEKWAEVPVNQLLFDHTNVSRGVNVEAVKAKTRVELVRARDDPTTPVGAPGLALANQWMGSFDASEQPLNESDRQLLARIFADSRVEASNGAWAIIARVKDNAPDLRRAAARRYLAANDKRQECQWINVLAALPEGAYATPLAEEHEILARLRTR